MQRSNQDRQLLLPRSVPVAHGRLSHNVPQNRNARPSRLEKNDPEIVARKFSRHKLTQISSAESNDPIGRLGNR